MSQAQAPHAGAAAVVPHHPAAALPLRLPAGLPFAGAGTTWLQDWNGVKVGIVGLVEEEWWAGRRTGPGGGGSPRGGGVRACVRAR